MTPITTYRTEVEGRTYEVAFSFRDEQRCCRATHTLVPYRSIWDRVYRIRKDGTQGQELSRIHAAGRRASAQVWEQFKAEHGRAHGVGNMGVPDPAP